MDQRTRKLMTIHKALNPRDDIDKLNMSRKGGKKLACVDVDASIQGLEIYIKKIKERLITATRNSINNTMINKTTTKKQNCEEKQLYGYFKRQTNEISREKT